MPRGGARPNSGGRRAGSGRPRSVLTLDRATASRLRVLTLARRQVAPATTEETVVAALVAAAHADYEQEHEHDQL